MYIVNSEKWGFERPGFAWQVKGCRCSGLLEYEAGGTYQSHSPLFLTVMSHQRTVSGITILSDDFVRRVLEDVDNAALATKDLVGKAKSSIGSLSNINVIEGMGKAAPILRAMIDYAPCKRGKRYAACAILCCDNEKPKLVNDANDWVRFLLLPCRSPVFFSQMPQLPQPTRFKFSCTVTRIQESDPSPLGLFYPDP